MSFNSWQFLLFLPVVVLLYWILPHKMRWVLLLIASYIFYMSWNAWLIVLIMITTVTAYGFAIAIEMTGKKRFKKLFLVITLIICLGLLVFFKYINFLLESIVGVIRLFNAEQDDIVLNIILPVGISFYTFQTLSYVIDVYRGDYKAERNFGYFALYVAYFPQLVAGPIERPQNLLPQLREEHKFNEEDMIEGCKWLLSGFFRKCVVADFCGIFVDRVYGNIDGSNGLTLFVASAIFFVQIYNDFAGYSEIAMGSARLMGVKLTKNFERPLSSCSVTEFFRRWHITLNQWFMQYVYIPLGGNRKGMARKIFNTLVVFSLCGLWHGANWTYFLWGLVAGIFVSMESLLRNPAKKIIGKLNVDIEKPALRLLRQIVVLFFFILACVLFRAQTVGEIGAIFVKIFTDWSFSGEYFASAMTALGMDTVKLIQLIIVIVGMALIYSFTLEKKDGTKGEGEEAPPYTMGKELKFTENFESLDTKNKERRKLLLAEENKTLCSTVSIYVYVVLAVALFWLGLLANSDVSAFTYFQF